MKLKVGTRVKIIGNKHDRRHLGHLIKIGTTATVVDSDDISVLVEGECKFGGMAEQWVDDRDFIVCDTKAVIV